MTRGHTTLAAAVRKSLGTDSSAPDAAARQLALTYATQIDGGEDLAKLGPALLAVLVQLGLTTAARAALTKGVPDANPATRKLDEIAERRARKNRAPDLDAAAT